MKRRAALVAAAREAAVAALRDSNVRLEVLDAGPHFPERRNGQSRLRDVSSSA